MSGKSPMKTVWLLISPVLLLMNSAVTNMGAEYVMSLSLHSSTEYLGGSNRWSRNDRDMVPVKSSIGLISSKISSRPDCSGISFSPAFCAAATRASQRSLPSSQSNESVCRARRPGTSSGSVKRAKETRRVAGLVAEALRDAANRGPSELVANFHRTHQNALRTRREGLGLVEDVRECSANWQCSRRPHRWSSVSNYEVHGCSAAWLVLGETSSPEGADPAHLGDVTNATACFWCGSHA